MKFRRSGRLKRTNIGPDIGPMADIVFLLLIFFMLSSSFVIQPGIELNLPKTETSQPQLKDDMILIIDSEQKMHLDNEPVSVKQLGRAIKERLPHYKNKLLIIKADQDVKHGFVVKVMDIAKQNNVKKLAIATERKKKGKR